MKKIFSLILATLLLLSVIPFSVSATETTTEKKDGYVRINGTEYAITNNTANYKSNTLSDELAKLDLGTTVTIELLGDIEVGPMVIPDKNLNITVNGNNYEWKMAGGDNYLVDQVAFAQSITFNEINFIGTMRGFRWADSDRKADNLTATSITTKFSGCTIKTSKNEVFKMRAVTNSTDNYPAFNLELYSTTITDTKGSQFLIFDDAANGNDVNIKIDSSILEKPDAGANNTYVLFYVGGPNMKVDITGNTTLTQTYTSTTSTIQTMFYTGGNTQKLEVNVDATATLTLNGIAKTGAECTFIKVGAPAKTSVLVTDKGATFVANAAAVNNGVTLPTVTGKQWKVKDTDTWVTSPYVNADATGAVSFVTATNNKDMVKVTVGETSETINVANLQGKLDGAEVGATVTVELLDNVTCAQINLPDKYLTVVINGNGYTWTQSASNGFIMAFLARTKSVTVNDTVFVSAGNGIHFENNAKVSNFTGDATTVEFNDCTVTTNGTTVQMNAATNASDANMAYNLKFNGSTVTGNGSRFVQIYDGIANPVTVTVNNSKLEMTKAGQPNYESGVIVYAGGKVLTLNVTGTSELIQTYTDADNNETMMYTGGSCTSFIMNVDSTASMTLNGNSDTAKYTFIRQGVAGTAVTVNDAGAKWIVNATVAKKGITLPTVTVAEGSTLLGFTAGAKLYGKTATIADATANVSFTAVTFDNDDFNMTGTASIRLEDPSGIRFKLGVSKALADSLGANAQYRVILAPAGYVSAENPLTNETAGCDYAEYNAETGWSATDDTTNYFRAALVFKQMGALTANTEISARGALCVTYADGTSEWFYTAKTDTASLVTVAELAKADPANAEYAELLQSIIDLKA